MSKQFRDTAPGEGHVTDLLSAYIDNHLDPEEHTRVGRHIRMCPDCRAGYIELRATRQLLHSLPTVAPTRSFTLTREMVEPARPAPTFWQRLLVPRNAPRLAAGSLLSLAVLLLILFAGAPSMRPTAAEATRPGFAAGAQAQQQDQSNQRSAPSTNAEHAATAPTTTAAAAAALGAAPAPAGTPAPEPPGAGGAASSGLSNPTTTTLDNSKAGGVPAAGTQPQISPVLLPEAETPEAGRERLVLGAEIGLGLLAVAMALGALVAWRKRPS